MTDSELHILIERYTLGTATELERAQLLEWYRSKDHTNVECGELGDVEIALERILFKTKIAVGHQVDVGEVDTVRRFFSFKKVAIAASICAILTISVLGYRYYQEQPATAPFISSVDEMIVPGSDQAILRMSDGRVISLGDEEQDGNTADFFNIVDGSLVLEGRDSSPKDVVVHSTLETPRGGQYKMVLSDGTKVFLNAESSIRFPTAFVEGQRRVTVSGEVYFEVAKDNMRPFIVTANRAEIQVLGTKFNVNTHTVHLVRTSLLEGSVKVSIPGHAVLLKPGQSADVCDDKSYVTVAETDLNADLAWIEGYFNFKNTPIKELMTQLARWYDVQVEYHGDMQGKEYSARILRRQHIQDILQKLEMTGTIKFKVDGKKIVVTP